MAQYKLLVLTNPNDGKTAEYNEWYSRQHVADMLGVPGFVSAQRFQVALREPSDSRFPWQYAAIYDLETEDLDATLKELSERAGTAVMPLSKACDLETMVAAPLVPIA
jgi:hypothetical protein